MKLEVLDDPAVAVADLLVATSGHVVLTGGSSPRRAYELAARGDWSGRTVWFSDERCVPPESGLSNFRMATDALLGRIMRDQRPAVMRSEGEAGPDAGAAAYEALVREHLGASPRWDVVLLGLGPDSHCASLFPGKPEVDERSRLVTGVELAGMEPQVPRISLTLPAINGARHVVFLVTGKDKAKAVKRAFGDPRDPSSPAAHVRPTAGEFTVILDEAAAEGLS